MYEQSLQFDCAQFNAYEMKLKCLYIGSFSAINWRQMHRKSDYKPTKQTLLSHAPFFVAVRCQSKKTCTSSADAVFGRSSRMKREKKRKTKYFLLLLWESRSPEFCFWAGVKSEWMQILGCTSLWPHLIFVFFFFCHTNRNAVTERPVPNASGFVCVCSTKWLSVSHIQSE